MLGTRVNGYLAEKNGEGGFERRCEIGSSIGACMRDLIRERAAEQTC
jgi:hypothetical protein